MAVDSALEASTDAEIPQINEHIHASEEECPVEIGVHSQGHVDLGEIIREANGSWDKLRSLVHHLADDKRKQYLSIYGGPK
uniref:Uncharacterized protein n=1 Tax=Amphimedon queenslandica TaxID=400682 RepID=A0A1X7UWC8_AMPQE